MESGTTRLAELWRGAGIEGEYIEAVCRALPSAATLSAGGVSGSQEPLSLFMLPALCCQAAGGKADDSVELAVAWSCIYSAAHILDNLADGVVPPSNLGPEVNVATGLVVGMGQILCSLEDSETVHDIQQRFYQTILTMCAGQHRALMQSELTLDQCWRLASDRSGGFFAVASWLGARAAIADLDQLAHFNEFGYQLGMLVQIGNDLGGLRGDDGKPSDLAAGGRWTLPVAYAMSVLSGEEQNHLRHALQEAPLDPRAEKEAYRCIVESGAVLYLSIEATLYRQRAKKTLEQAQAVPSAQDQLLILLQQTGPNPSS